jgi:hypothetical protein
MFAARHETDIFFEVLNIAISTFCVCADVFLRSFKSFSQPVPNTNINFIFASLKLLT